MGMGKAILHGCLFDQSEENDAKYPLITWPYNKTKIQSESGIVWWYRDAYWRSNIIDFDRIRFGAIESENKLWNCEVIWDLNL